MTELTVFQVKEMKKADIMAIPGVVGIGVGKGSRERINVYVREMTPQVLGQIPKLMDGFEVNVIESGDIVALPLMSESIPRALVEEREQRIRPAPPGCSCGNMMISAGTFGCVFHDNTNGRRVILSNAHVLTPDASLPTASEMRIVQPGVADGGAEDDIIAHLTRYVPLQVALPLPNKVDCAIATPISDADISDEIMGVGVPAGIATTEFGHELKKSGRTTAVTQGTVIDMDATVKVGYAGGYDALFSGCIMTTHMADGGDSGSALLDMDNNVVGLVFAGSANLTCHIKIQEIMDALNVSLDGGVPPPPQMASLGLLALGIGGAYILSKIMGK